MRFHPSLPLLLFLAPLAGCLGDETVTPAAAVEPAPAAVAPEPVVLAEDGSFGPGVWACPVVACVGSPSTGDRRYWDHDVGAGAVAVNLTLTWTPATPAMERLQLNVFGCAGGCRSSDDMGEWEAITGPSPLVIALDGFPLAEGEKVYVSVTAPGRTPVVYAAAAAPQTFRLEGTLTPALVDAAAVPAEPAGGR